MKTNAFALGAMLLFSSALVPAQAPPVPQPPAGAPGAQGRGQRPAPDPALHGRRRLPRQPLQLRRRAESASGSDTVWLEEMTWMDVRDALKAGKTTVIIPTGGIEPNGPWLALGKHNYVLRTNCDAIARKLGNALCAPIIALVPEGAIEPKSGHMLSPGTISMREETFQALLTDVAHSLKMHGFENIIFIGDSGGNQAVRRRLPRSSPRSGTALLSSRTSREYYTAPPGTPNVLRQLGVVNEGQADDGLHDSPGITLNMMLTDPNSVRWEQRVKAGKATINGVSIADKTKSLELARRIVDARATRTADVIRKAIANKGKTE